jgi:hypothetical protein
VANPLGYPFEGNELVIKQITLWGVKNGVY